MRPLRAIVLALLCLAPPAVLAQHGSIGIGFYSPEGSFQPEVSPRDLKVIIRVLDLKPDEQAALENLHAGYVATLKAKSDEIKTFVERVLEEAEILEDRSRLDPARGKIDEWERDADRIKKSFLDDLRSLLTGEQESKWPIVERELRRMKRIGAGRLSGESVDVIRLVEEVAPESLATPAVSELAERYAQDLDRLLVAREQAVDANQDAFGKALSNDARTAERMWNDAQNVRKAILDVNARYAREIGAQLPAERAAVLSRKFFEASHAKLCKPTRGEEYIRAAAKLASLSSQQSTATAEIVDRYDRARYSILKRQAEIEDELQLTALPAFLAKALGRTGPEADDSFDGRSKLPADHPLMQLRRERYELDRATRRQVEALLTAEQRDSVPEVRPGSARFENWDPYQL